MPCKILKIYEPPENTQELSRIPLGCPVPAGWPSPAEDYIQGELNLHEHFVKNTAASYLVEVVGDSMIGAGIHDGDVMVVNRSKTPHSGNVVVAIIDGEPTIKRFIIDKKSGRKLLVPENPNYSTIDVTGREDAMIWGVATSVHHNL